MRPTSGRGRGLRGQRKQAIPHAEPCCTPPPKASLRLSLPALPITCPSSHCLPILHCPSFAAGEYLDAGFLTKLMCIGRELHDFLTLPAQVSLPARPAPPSHCACAAGPVAWLC